MSRLLPFKSEPSTKPDEPRVLDLDDEATEAALSALSSETARKILATVYEEPKTPPEIRDEVGTSLQNVHYHVEQLEDADLIQPAGSGYSEKGTEMTIYGPASQAVVLFAGQERHRSRLKTALTRLLGAVGLLAFASLAVRRLVEATGTGIFQTGDPGATEDPAVTDDTGTGTAEPSGTVEPDRGENAGVAATDTPAPDSDDVQVKEETAMPTESLEDTPAATAEPPTYADTQSPTSTPQATSEPAEAGNQSVTAAPTDTSVPGPETVDGARQTTESAVQGGLLADPAVTFFLGGLFMILVVGAWWYLQD